MSSSAKHEVVGAGIVGFCCALSLMEKGPAVTMIDREPPAAGTSSGNAGGALNNSVMEDNRRLVCSPMEKCQSRMEEEP